MRPLNVGLLGFGTVGRGVYDVLARNGEEIARRAGRPIRVHWIGTRTLDRVEPYAQATVVRGPVSIMPGARVTFDEQWGTAVSPRL